MRSKIFKKDPIEVRNVITTSRSISQCLDKLGLKITGSNYHSFKTFCSVNDISTAHFSGQGWNNVSGIRTTVPTSDYLDNTRRIHSHPLKLRLIKEGIKKAECESCKISTWLGSPAPLELDHIDGNHLNNDITNLRILCPNCHALTPTFCGGNKRSRRKLALIPEEAVAKAVTENTSRYSALTSLGLRPHKGTYKFIDMMITKLGVSFKSRG